MGNLKLPYRHQDRHLPYKHIAHFPVALWIFLLRLCHVPRLQKTFFFSVLFCIGPVLTSSTEFYSNPNRYSSSSPLPATLHSHSHSRSRPPASASGLPLPPEDPAGFALLAAARDSASGPCFVLEASRSVAVPAGSRPRFGVAAAPCWVRSRMACWDFGVGIVGLAWIMIDSVAGWGFGRGVVFAAVACSGPRDCL